MTKEYIKELGLWKHDDHIKRYTIPNRVKYTLDEEGKILHSEHEPALRCSSNDGTKWEEFWYKFNLQHRDGDLPAYMDSKGKSKWYKNGDLHRDGNQPAVTEADGTKKWYINGQYGRTDQGPTVVQPDGTQLWLLQEEDEYQDNIYHNIHGPAVIHSDGSVEYWLGGNRITEELFNKIKQTQ